MPPVLKSTWTLSSPLRSHSRRNLKICTPTMTESGINRVRLDEAAEKASMPWVYPLQKNGKWFGRIRLPANRQGCLSDHRAAIDAHVVRPRRVCAYNKLPRPRPTHKA